MTGSNLAEASDGTQIAAIVAAADPPIIARPVCSRERLVSVVRAPASLRLESTLIASHDVPFLLVTLWPVENASALAREIEQHNSNKAIEKQKTFMAMNTLLCVK